MRADATDRKRWGEAFDLIEKAAHQTAPTSTGMPALRVDVTIPPDTWCGVPRPDVTGRRFALRLEIDPREGRDPRGCPLTIDLYRSERVIDTVVVYTAKARRQVSVDPPGCARSRERLPSAPRADRSRPAARRGRGRRSA